MRPNRLNSPPKPKSNSLPKEGNINLSVNKIEVTLTNGSVLWAEGEHAREMYMWWIACEGFAEREGVIPRVKGFNVREPKA